MAVDDPRVKHVLKRYPKTSDIADAEVELTGVSCSGDSSRSAAWTGHDDVYRPQEVTGKSCGIL